MWKSLRGILRHLAVLKFMQIMQRHRFEHRESHTFFDGPGSFCYLSQSNSSDLLSNPPSPSSQFGMKYYDIKNKQGAPLTLGVHPRGLFVYRLNSVYKPVVRVRCERRCTGLSTLSIYEGPASCHRA